MKTNITKSAFIKAAGTLALGFFAAASALAYETGDGSTVVEKDGLLQLASGSLTLSESDKEVSSLAVGQFGAANGAYSSTEAAAGDGATMTITGNVLVNACYYTDGNGTTQPTTEIWVGKAHNTAESPAENSEAFKLIVDGGSVSYKGDVDMKVVNTGSLEIINGGSLSCGIIMIRNKVLVDGPNANLSMTLGSIYGETGVTADVSLTNGAEMTVKGLTVGHASNQERSGSLELSDSSLDVTDTLTIYSGDKNEVTLNDSTLKTVALVNSGTLSVLGESELTTTGEVTLASGSETTIGGTATWNAENTVSVASGATLNVDVSSAAANIVFSKNAALVLADGAVLNLVVGEGDDLQLNTIYLNDIFENAAIDVGNDVTVKILNTSGAVLAQSTITLDESGKQVVVIPEPSAFGLLAGLSALAFVAARRRRK